MNRIRLLSEQVCNQIAAGEVVERPASVVKELVENALDAGARRIVVEIQAGGRSLIRVSDDGHGMSKDDALLCLERHATSKIQRAEDLAAISTLGFRGEALPSIASVSRFVLTTRERGGDSLEGTRVVIQGGKIIEVKAAGAPEGTSIEVRQLFFNLPARRKFLRSEETEQAHLEHYLTLAALSHPEVALVYQRDGRPVWDFPAVSTGQSPAEKLLALRERLRALYGRDQAFLPLDNYSRQETLGDADEGQGYDLNLRLWGFIGPPGSSRSNREDQHLFVNRRPVENRGLNFALLEGYHTALMKGRYPICCLFLEIDPAAVDVNIHPSKREVKFHQEAIVRRKVAEAVRQCLLDVHRPETKAGDPINPVAPTANPLASEFKQESAEKSVHPQAPGSIGSPLAERLSQMGKGLYSRTPPLAGTPSPELEPLHLEPLVPQLSMPLSAVEEELRVAAPPAGGLLQIRLRQVGIVGKLYVVFESERGLVLMDQHAAHERVLYEQMLKRLEQSEAAPSQRLLLPETVELSGSDAAFIRPLLPTLSRLGVGLSEFGERTFLVDALPPFVRAREPRVFVRSLVDELKRAGEGVNNLRLGEGVVAKTVCRHAVKANDTLAAPEVEQLLRDLRLCQMPYTCPHGRPTLIELNYRELEKKFGRQA